MTTRSRLKRATLRSIAQAFDALDFSALSTIYCDEGGEEFWNDRREPCQALGIGLAEILRDRLRPGGRSLYVGAGVAEIPVLAMETLDLHRKVAVFNLRAEEVSVLNAACRTLPFRFVPGDAGSARGTFDHLWIVSVLNDPERFPDLSALVIRAGESSHVPPELHLPGNARRSPRSRTACLKKVARPALVTTSVEEIPWITSWCDRKKIACAAEEEEYPTAIVEDPVCFIRLGNDARRKR